MDKNFMITYWMPSIDHPCNLNARWVFDCYFILSVTTHINCMLPDKHCQSHGMYLYQVMMTLQILNYFTNDAESTQKSIITS